MFNILKIITFILMIKCIVSYPAYQAVHPKQNGQVLRAIAVLKTDWVVGTVNFEQIGDGQLRIFGQINSLTQGYHGFHVHQFGNLTDGCASTGSHYNIFQKNHGGPKMLERHLGDLGNIEANAQGVAKFDFYDWLLRLDGPRSIMGRSIVVHQNIDDYGLGTSPLSLTTGNSGARVACAVIGNVN